MNGMSAQNVDVVYINLVKTVLRDGFQYRDESRDVWRTQIPHYQIFLPNGSLSRPHGFLPMLTTKRIHFHSIATELIWFLRGEDHIQFLRSHGVKIWDADGESYLQRLKRLGRSVVDLPEGYVGKIYGPQWRSYGAGEDQLVRLLNGFIKYPTGTRHIVTAWNPEDLNDTDTSLPPCHWSFELLYDPKGFYLKWHQRSVDLFLGLPFNITSYALLGQLISLVVGKPLLGIVGDLSNVHIYANHLDAVMEQLKREPYIEGQPALRIDDEVKRKLKQLGKEPITTQNLDNVVFTLEPQHFTLDSYKSHGTIRATMIAPKS